MCYQGYRVLVQDLRFALRTLRRNTGLTLASVLILALGIGVNTALFGTVLLVLLMSVAVVPLGVVTAVYMTEYARAGLPLRLANQAVNNLAGVPSIVFGMFGLAFFVYEVGGVVDRALFSDVLPTPTFGTGDHCPGVRSRRRSPLVPTRRPFWMMLTPPWWPSG